MSNAEEILELWSQLPDEVKGRKAPSHELEAFESEYGTIPVDYRWFLRECGGGPVGPDWIDGIGELANTHAKFRSESIVHNGWTSTGFIIGWDGAGNPILIDETGKVIVEDHNFGGIHELSSSFRSFLLARLRGTT